MKILQVNPKDLRASYSALEEAARALYEGKVVVIPTDTVYGLAVDATNEEAIKRLFAVKQRPADKPVPVAIRDLDMARKVAYFDKKCGVALGKIWPGPVTVLLEKKRALPASLSAGQKTIGLRIPDYKLVNFLIELLGRPITATSANISGQPPSTKINDVTSQFEKTSPQPDLILSAGDLVGSAPSTVLDLSGKEPKIVRIGPVSKKKLLEILSI